MYADLPAGAGQFARQHETVAAVVAGPGADQHATAAESARGRIPLRHGRRAPSM
jgi:hypothetical protein